MTPAIERQQAMQNVSLDIPKSNVVLWQHMMRTSITLPTTLHQRLVSAAQYNRQTVTDLIRNLLDQALATQEQRRTSQMYQDLAELRGIGPKGVNDASMTINDTLYGERRDQQAAKNA